MTDIHMDDQVPASQAVPQRQEHYNEVEDSEEDEVIAEYDICLAGSIREQLQLLQYPLRPCFRQYGDHGTLKNVEVAVETRTEATSSGGPQKPNLGF